jgi:hypothetical protein
MAAVSRRQFAVAVAGLNSRRAAASTCCRQVCHAMQAATFDANIDASHPVDMYDRAPRLSEGRAGL